VDLKRAVFALDCVDLKRAVFALDCVDLKRAVFALDCVDLKRAVFALGKDLKTIHPYLDIVSYKNDNFPQLPPLLPIPTIRCANHKTSSSLFPLYIH
jgi:hypothetical protein